MIDRSEISGLSLATLGHAGLLALIWHFSQPVPVVEREPPVSAIEVTLADEVALESSVPVPGTEAPAAASSPEDAPPEPATAEPPPDATQPPRDRTNQRPPSNTQNRRDVTPTDRLKDLDLRGNGDSSNDNDSPNPPAVPGPVRNALSAELTRKLRPHWRAPTGADADKLKTVIRVELGPNGAVVRMGECRQTGITDSNRAQLALHCENAKRAIRLAAPFNTFPAQYYDAWKVIFPEFDRNLR